MVLLLQILGESLSKNDTRKCDTSDRKDCEKILL